VPGQSFGKTWSFFGFSGQVHVSCALPVREQRPIKQNVPTDLKVSPDFMLALLKGGDLG